MVAGSDRIQGMGLGYVGAVIGSDSGRFGWWEMGILTWCGSVKKEIHRKFEGGAWELGIWRRLVLIFSGVVVGTVWIQLGEIEVNSGG